MSELITHHDDIEAARVSAKALMVNCAGEVTVKKMRRDQVIRNGSEFFIIPGKLQVVCVMPNVPDPEDITKRTGTLNWTMPTKRGNNDVLTPAEIAYFRVRYRAEDDTVYTVVNTQGKPLMMTVDNLEVSKAYSFQLLTVDSIGVEGPYSEVATLAAN